MAEPRSHHELTFRPEYALFTIRDLDADARVGADQAIAGAHQDVAAATEYEIYVKVAQLDLPITAALEVWDALPATPPTGPPWQLVNRFELPFSSGVVLLGDGGGQSIYGPWLRPGLYTADVWSTGRSDAVHRATEIDAATEGMDIYEKIDYQDRNGSGIERYLIRLGWLAELPEDDEN